MFREIFDNIQTKIGNGTHCQRDALFHKGLHQIWIVYGGIAMINTVDIEFDSLMDICRWTFLSSMDTDTESPLSACIEIWSETRWRIPVFCSAHAKGSNLMIPWSQLIQCLQSLFHGTSPHYSSHVKAGNTFLHIMNSTENSAHDSMKRQFFFSENLWIEEKFCMDYPISRSSLKISMRKIVKVLFCD